MQKTLARLTVIILGLLLLAVLPLSGAHALSTLEEGCLDCHYRGSSIVPGTRQFQNSTSWHTFHKNYSCSSCHPGSAGSKPIAVASCGSCHNTSCAWQDFHETNVGPTCYDCHAECYTPLPQCGNGIIEAGEQCDDGNTRGGDCCEANCQLAPAASPCPDSVYCNGVETCDGKGNCLAGVPVACSDGVACTDDSCDERNRTCVTIPNDSNCSDDGLFCNGDEFCDALNGCVSSGDPCQNGTVCNEGSGTCDLQAACGDGIVDQGEDCDDGNVEDGDCCSALCGFEPAGSSCADNQYCNGEETCDGAGACQPGVAIACDDGIACTVDACDEVNDECAYTPDSQTCDDRQYCNGVERCDLLMGCVAGTPVDCNDGVGCTIDECDENRDTCTYTPDHNSCPDDGLFCNGDEFCHPQDDCSSRGDPCLDGTVCDEGAGYCGPPPSCGDGIVDRGEECDDGNTAGGDCCGVDCQFEASGSSCRDDQYCNGEETCNGRGSCEAGTPVDCSDGVACTVDACDEVHDVCVNVLNDNNCPDDGLFCTGQEICDPVNGCVSTGNPCGNEGLCDEVSDQCAAFPRCVSEEDCDDGLFCNGAEFCDAEGMCQTGSAPCLPEETCSEETGQCVASEADLDIANLRVTKWVRLKRVKEVEIIMTVKNTGTENAARRHATVSGIQNGVECYNQTMLVTAPSGNGRTAWSFPPYKPTAEGTIAWTATIEDEDPDGDEKRGTTIVLP